MRVVDPKETERRWMLLVAVVVVALRIRRVPPERIFARRT